MDEPSGVKAQIDFLKATLKRESGSYSKKRDKYSAKAFWFKIGVVASGAATTVLLGIKPYFADWEAEISIVALLISAFVPVALAWEAFFDYRWLWVRYNATLMALYSISDDLNFRELGSTLSSEDVKGFYDRLETTLKENDSAWFDKRMSDIKAEQDRAAAAASTKKQT
jgi:hypothetical protein